METTSLRRRLVGESWIVSGTSVLAAVLLAPGLAAAAEVGLGVAGASTSSSPEFHVVLLVPAVLLSFAVAEVGVGVVPSLVIGVPYFVTALREFHCYSSPRLMILCDAPPTVADVLPRAVLMAMIAGTVGYGSAWLAARRHREPQ